jgi:hypothetical protein
MCHFEKPQLWSQRIREFVDSTHPTPQPVSEAGSHSSGRSRHAARRCR